jgi:hypothetical protein
VLAIRPTLDGSAYFNRKLRYALNAQIIVDDTCWIRFFYLGFPGSVHDARAFGACDLARQPERCFQGEEYILADSAYALTPTVIPAYRGGAARESENARFNYLHSTVRVAAEHAIGQLKGRFGSLRGLRVWICDKKSHEKAIRWVEACFVLHNLLLGLNEDMFDEDLGTGVVSEDNTSPIRSAEIPIAISKRESLKRRVIDFNECA